MSVGSLLRFKRFAQFVSIALTFVVSPVPDLLAQGGPSAITLTTSATPATAEPAVTVVSLTGSGFPSGTINPTDVQVQLQPIPPSTGPAMVALVSAVTTLFGSSRRITFQALPSSAANNIKTPTAYSASVTGKTAAGLAFSSGNTSFLTINPPASILSVSPSVLAPGGTATVTIKGQYSNFFQGSSQANFGPGISVGGATGGAFGPITVVDAFTATAQISVSTTAGAAVNDVSVRTGVEVATLTQGFTISSSPVITAITPNTGQQGQQALAVSITGQFTHFVQGTSSVSFGAGISLTSLTVNSATSATAVLNIAVNAAAGARNVTFTTGSEAVTLSNGFSVTNGNPLLTQVNPNAGVQGQQNLSVTLTGQFTHFAQGTSVASIGAGITVTSLTVNSATSAVAVLNIAANAAAGARTVTVTTGAEAVTLANSFTVANGTPALTQVGPNTGQQGQQNLSVSLTGQFTHFVQGTSVATFGAGISIVSLTVTSSTAATAVLNIAGNAALGASNVTVTTGSEVVTVPNGFSVTNGAPVLTQANPNTGQQGQQNLAVSLTGQFTHFAQGTSVASFGAGIAVTSLAVQSATSATAVINVAANAAAGVRNVTLTTGGEVVTLTNGFTVTSGTPALTQVSPNNGAQGQQTLAVTLTGQFTNFVQGTSIASFGAGVTVASLTVNSATAATAVLNIASNAAAGARNVTVTTGAEVVTLANGFTVTNGSPVLTQVVPNAGQQGQQNLSAALTGQFTHFVQGTSVASFGAGITVVSLTVNSATSATAILNVAASAAAGARSVTVTTGAEAVTLTNGFTVTNGTPVLTQVSPSTGQQGQQNLSVTLTGQFTHFVQGTSVASFGAGITVASLTVTSTTSATAVLNVAASATAGTHAVTVTTGAEAVTLSNGFTVTTGTPVLTQVSPNTGQQGQQNLSVTLTGQFTHFVQGTSVASFGAGITVASLTVTSATSATAVLNVAATATGGAHAVTITTGTEAVTLTNGFTVTNGTPVLTQVSPNTGLQGQQNLSVTLTGQFTHFVQGTSVASFGTGITVASLTVASATSATAVLNIAANATPGTSAVTVTTGTEAVALANGFTITNGTPVLTLINPTSGQQGQQALSVTLTGQFTHFVQGTSVASFGTGITVASLTVASATSATAVLNVAANATAGARNVTVTTGTEIVTLTNGFTVTSGTPVLTLVNPNTGQQGQQALSVTLTGQFTHFVQGTSVASFGAGITVASLTVASATSATAVLNIAANATPGASTVTVTTGAEAVTVTNGFTVTNGTPALTQASPNTGQQGQQTLSVTLTGQFTHFVQGTTAASFGAGITIASVTIASATSATAVLNIAASATTGARNVTVTTGTEIVTLTNGFTVTNGTPALTQVSPNTGQQGQQTLSVTLTGQFTHLVQGTSVASFGTGITVASLTVVSATSATAVLNVAANATAGARNVTVTTGTEIVTLTNGFTVTNGTPALTQVSPNTGQQGQQTLSIALTGQFTHFVQGTSVASFGTGITVASLTVASATSATAVLNIAANATAGARNVTVTTGTEIVTLTNGFTVTNGTPALTQVSPNTGQQGQQTLSVTVTGQFTHFVQGTSVASFGAGITVASLTVASATSATAVLNVAANATAGARNVTVTTGTEIVTLTNGFTVTSGTPAMTQVSPNTGQQGQQTLSIALTGQFTHFVQGTSVASFGAGITVASLTVSSATSATAVINIAANAAAGATNVTITTASEIVTLTSGFTVTTGTPLLTQVNPNTGQQGQQNLSVTLTGQFTHFVQGTTTASFGAGITIASLTVSSATAATAVLNIAAAAATGARNVTLATGAETVTLNNGFTVTAAAPLLTQVNPNSGQQGQQNLLVTITGQFTHFTAASLVTFSGTGVTAGSPNAVNATSVTVQVTIAANAAVGARTVQVVTGPENVSLAGSFTVAAGGGSPSITSVSPGFAKPTQAIQVTIIGQNTHFVQGSTKADFGPGVSVGGGIAGAAGPVLVTNATTAVAQISVPANAALGSRTVSVITGTEQASLANGFAVFGTPALISIAPGQANVGQTLTVTINGAYTNFQQGVTQATFGAGIAVGGGSVGGAGLVTVTGPHTATAQLSISASASPGLRDPLVATGTEQESLAGGFLILGPVTGAPPAVTITSPSTGSEVNALTTVTGTVTSPNLASWTLEYAGSGSTVFTQFAHGAASTVSGVFDPTMLLNGLATIRLTGVDQSGQTRSATVQVVVARNAKVGNFTVSFTDLSIPVAGLPIQVVRTYDSRSKNSGDFGFGWTLAVNSISIQTNGILGDNWTGTSSGGFLPTYCVQAPTNLIVSVRLKDGTVYQFSPVASPGTQCQQIIPPEFVDISFVPVGNTPPNAKLSAPLATSLFVSGSFPGSLQLLDIDTAFSVDPDQYVLTLPAGQQLQLSRTFGVQSIIDRTGNTLTFGTNGITSSTGKGVAFARDGSGRITSITDPNGSVQHYTYSAIGDLATSVDAMNNTSTYSYDGAHDLVSYTNPLGIQPLRNTYDDAGRLIQITDALGHVINLGNDVASRTESTTDALGNPTTYVYNANGNIVSAVNALGDAYSATFDAKGNKLTQTNALGKTITNSFDTNSNLLTETDPQGNKFTYTYNSFNQILTVKDSLGGVTNFTYDSVGNLLTTTDPSGNVTTSTYNAQGKLTSRKDPLGRSTSFQYDANGYMTQQTDAAGVATTYSNDANGNQTSATTHRTKSDGTTETLVTQYLYDSNNRLIRTTNPDGSTIVNVYNSAGQKTDVTDPLGHTTHYDYDATGRIVKTTHPDGTADSFTFDANGNKTSSTDRAGRTTTYQYDALNRLSATLFPDGSKIQRTFDKIGHLVQSIDPLGHTTKYAFDDSGRQTSITNALNQITSLAYDANGNQISETDANNHVTQYVYDTIGQRTKTIYPDATFETRTYDPAGQLTSTTDQAGKTTQYTYDALGRLIKVTDALLNVTSYQYDEVGNRISQTDASGRVTLYSYDKVGHRVGRTLPLGQSESYAYDADGDLTSKTDFNGRVTTFTYDPVNQLTAKAADPFFSNNHIGNAQVLFSYTNTGTRASMTDGTGTTNYTYDSLDRLLVKTTPFGTLSYAYDLAGNELSVQTSHPGGANMTYNYDALNRLQSVADPAGTSTYTYDPAGNLASTAYPNTVQSTYSYDTLNRLTQMGSSRSGTNISRYTYTLDPSGHRTMAQELNGRTAQYTYDSLYRLTAETISSAGSQNGVINYTLDKTGNRTQTASTVAAIPAGLQNYDANDRLSTDTYDAAGNTVASGGTNNVYDFEGRLTQSGSVAIAYDGDGNRISKTAGGITTTYLVDSHSQSGYAQVLEELQSGAVTRSYSYGLQIIDERQTVSGAAKTSFYGLDGAGSVRFLLDTAGTVTDTYDYDAFGNLIGSTGSTPNLYRFGGQQFDPDLNLYYNRARYLDPRTGRFRTMDQNEGGDVDPVSLHKYLYAGANPVGNDDPSGYAYLSNLIYGNEVHQIIGDDYEGGGGCSDAQIIALVTSPILNSVCGPRIVGLRGISGGYRPDLADPRKDKGETFEIKPINSAASGLTQLIRNLWILKLMDRRVGGPTWHLGTAGEYTPPSRIPLSDGLAVAYVAPPVLGVIVYYVVGLDDVVILSAAAVLAALGAGAAAAAAAAEAAPAVGALIRAALAAISTAFDAEISLDIGLAFF